MSPFRTSLLLACRLQQAPLEMFERIDNPRHDEVRLSQSATRTVQIAQFNYLTGRECCFASMPLAVGQSQRHRGGFQRTEKSLLCTHLRSPCT